jgi:hypothetical protein
MKRVNLFEIYQCGGALKAIERLRPNTVVSEVKAEMMIAALWLNWLTRDLAIVDNREEAERLQGFIKKLADVPDGEVLGIKRHIVISSTFSHLESALSVELARRLQVYSITPVLGYDSDVLLSSGRATLPESTLKLISEDTKKGFDEATRCLVLKQPTAAGFLLLRSVEDVMHDYYHVISNGSPRPARRNMGDYIAALERISDVSQTMLDVLRSIKNLRRNPLMHPERRLEMDDAIETFDIAKSSISAMARLAAEHAAKAKP